MNSEATVERFELLPWQREAWSCIQAERTSGRLHHALLIGGLPGLGKLRLARALAHALFCREPAADGTPCGRCRPCHLFQVGNHPDLHRVEPDAQSRSGEIRVDAIREMTGSGTLSAHGGGYKVVIIHPAERMNPSAANSLLKTLEEPTPETLLLLVTSHPGRLLPTVRSRCQLLTLKPPPETQAVAWLEAQGVQGDLRLALRLSGGAPLAARALLESHLLQRRAEALDRFLELGHGSGDPVALAAAWMQWDLPQLLDWMNGWVADLLRLDSGHPAPHLSNPDRAVQLAARAGQGDAAGLHRFWARLLMAREQLRETNLNPQLVLEALLVEWFQMAARH
jgi:DNA polymerase-3 subunit delta'